MSDTNDPDILKAIGLRLKSARQSVGISQRDACAAMGVGTSAWNHWEMGRRSPDLITLIRFTEKYGLSIEWILRGNPASMQFNPDQLADIGHRLRAARQAADISSEDFAAAIGVGTPALEQWETGQTAPDFHAMSRSARLFGITLDWIYLGDPEGLPRRIAGQTLRAVS